MKINTELSIPAEANRRFADLSLTEHRKYGGCRVIGGDKGDLRFYGYTVQDGKTVLSSPELVTSIVGLSDDEATSIAQSILDESYASIGVECVEHN